MGFTEFPAYVLGGTMAVFYYDDVVEKYAKINEEDLPFEERINLVLRWVQITYGRTTFMLGCDETFMIHNIWSHCAELLDERHDIADDYQFKTSDGRLMAEYVPIKDYIKEGSCRLEIDVERIN